MQCNSLLWNQSSRQGSVQQQPEMRIYDHRNWTRVRYQLLLTQDSLWSSTSHSGFKLFQKCLNSHSCLQEEHARIKKLGLPSPWPPRQPSVRHRLLTQVRTLTNPSIFFWNERVRARLRKTVHLDVLWSYGEWDLVLRPASNLFRKLGQHARRNMSFISPFITHAFTRNSKNVSKVEKRPCTDLKVFLSEQMSSLFYHQAKTLWHDSTNTQTW